jgi:hypothetical protein
MRLRTAAAKEQAADACEGPSQNGSGIITENATREFCERRRFHVRECDGFFLVWNVSMGFDCHF